MFCIAEKYFGDIFLLSLPREEGRLDFLVDIDVRLSPDQCTKLGTDFEVIDVKTSVFSMGLYKALSLNGFHCMFFQKIWDMVGEDVCRLWSPYFY